MRRFAFSCVALASLWMATGCGAAVGDNGSNDPAQDQSSSAAKAKVCPMIYKPVCGKDGKTYANECIAGGPQHVAYAGECIDPCAGLLCKIGTHCESKGHHAQCVADAPFDPCMTVKCTAGYHCESVQIECITTPCNPIAQCTPTLCSDPKGCGPALGMPITLCPDGVNYSGPTGNCLDYGGSCGWEVLSCP